MPEGCAVIQRDNNKLEKRTDRNLSSNRHTLKHRGFHLNIKENFLCEADQDLAHAAQGGFGVSPWRGDRISCLELSGHGPGTTALGDPA